MPSIQPSQMKIESLLNPSTDKGNCAGFSHSQHTPMLSSLASQSCNNTPIALEKHRCGQYLRAQYTSQRTIPTAPAKAHTNGVGRNKLHLQYHSKHQLILYQPSDLASRSQKFWQRHRSQFNTLRTESAYRRRSPRPKYKDEEMHFIWYHRVELSQQWKAIHESFNREFPNRQRLGLQSIQSKFYRFIKQKNCLALREQRHTRDSATIGSSSYSP